MSRAFQEEGKSAMSPASKPSRAGETLFPILLQRVRTSLPRQRSAAERRRPGRSYPVRMRTDRWADMESFEAKALDVAADQLRVQEEAPVLLEQGGC